MINWTRMFSVYRALADSFDAYLRIVVFRQELKGLKRLQEAIDKEDKKTRLIPKESDIK